jgi:hypothetical protein
MENMLRRFTAQRAVLRARPPAVLDLPLPGLRGAEEVWRRTASDMILSSRVRPFVGPVAVTLTFRDGRPACGFRDLPNACLQLLIGTRLIAGAHSAILRRLTLNWGEVSGVRVEICPSDGGDPHGA